MTLNCLPEKPVSPPRYQGDPSLCRAGGRRVARRRPVLLLAQKRVPLFRTGWLRQLDENNARLDAGLIRCHASWIHIRFRGTTRFEVYFPCMQRTNHHGAGDDSFRKGPPLCGHRPSTARNRLPRLKMAISRPPTLTERPSRSGIFCTGVIRTHCLLPLTPAPFPTARFARTAWGVLAYRLPATRLAQCASICEAALSNPAEPRVARRPSLAELSRCPPVPRNRRYAPGNSRSHGSTGRRVSPPVALPPSNQR